MPQRTVQNARSNAAYAPPQVSLCKGIQMEIPRPFSLYYSMASHDKLNLPWSKIDLRSGTVFACGGSQLCIDSAVCASCMDLPCNTAYKAFVGRACLSNADLAGPQATMNDAFLSHQQMQWKNESKRQALKTGALVTLNASKKITRLAQVQTFHNHMLLLISQNKILRFVSVCISLPRRPCFFTSISVSHNIAFCRQVEAANVEETAGEGRGEGHSSIIDGGYNKGLCSEAV